MGNKKSKLITRIIACVLAVVTVVGIIAPVVSATELENNEDAIVTTTPNDVPAETAPQIEENTDGVIQENNNDNEVPSILPNGLYWAKVDGEWKVQVDKSANVVPITIVNDDREFDASEIVVFVANLETHEVKKVNLESYFSYYGTIDMKPGYYVAYANNIAWNNSQDIPYTINNNDYVYFSIGAETENYGVKFHDATNGLRLNLTSSLSSQQVVPYGQSLFVTDGMKEFPEDIMFVENPTVDQEHSTQDIPEVTDPSEEKSENESMQLSSILLKMLKRSIIPLAVIACCFIAIKVRQRNAYNKNSKRAEYDKYDDSSIE